MNKDRNTYRWQKAQEAELRFWQKKYVPPEPEATLVYIKRELKKFNLNISNFEGKRILEVGCGPKGPISFLPKAEKYGIDPLLNQYKKMGCYLSPEVKYSNRSAEKTGFKDSFFDFVICYNTLDHCNRIDDVLGETHRILKKNGLLVLEVHVLKDWARFFSPILNQLDRCHPHHLTQGQVKNQLIASGFIINRENKIGFLSNRMWLIRFFRKLLWQHYYLTAKK